MNTAGFRMPDGKKLPLRLWYARNFPLLPKCQIQGLNAFAFLATYLGVKKKMSKDARRGLLAPYNNWKNRFAIYRFIQDIALYPNDPSYETIKETDEHLHKLRGKPMLILWGKGDFIFDMEILDVWRQRFPEAKVGIVEDAGHYIIEDVPETVIEQMERFLTEDPLEEGKD
jgi:haloalkane dehalogenase